MQTRLSISWIDRTIAILKLADQSVSGTITNSPIEPTKGPIWPPGAIRSEAAGVKIRFAPCWAATDPACHIDSLLDCAEKFSSLVKTASCVFEAGFRRRQSPSL